MPISCLLLFLKATLVDSHTSSKIVQFNTTFCTSITDNLNHVRHNVNLHGVILIILMAIVCIHKTLFQSLIYVVINYNRVFIVFGIVDVFLTTIYFR